jgi:hypothetical protein
MERASFSLGRQTPACRRTLIPTTGGGRRCGGFLNILLEHRSTAGGRGRSLRPVAVAGLYGRWPLPADGPVVCKIIGRQQGFLSLF